LGRKAREKRERRERAGLTPSLPPSWRPGQRLVSWLWGPAPIARLAAIRILVPLAILGFFSSRLLHADDWIGSAGFHVPNVGGDDYRQPLYLPALPNGVAWTLAALAFVSGMALSAGAFTRVANPLFAALLVYFALADRLAAFTVSKLGAALVVALAFTPSAARASLDAYRFRRANPDTPPPTEVTGGNVRFFQLTLAVMYAGTGVSKLRGDWLTRSDVIYTNLHDSYQTTFSYLLAAHVPGWAWTAFQWLVLTLETGAPLWLALPFTRRPAVALLLGMHAIIGLGFGPVIWFALLMASLLLACFAPRHWLERALRI
jgi:Vitamin K-dependent gamma-carboxylase